MKITSAAPLPALTPQLCLKPDCMETRGVLGALMHPKCGMDIFLPKKSNKIVRFKNIFFAPCRASMPILPTVHWQRQWWVCGECPSEANWLCTEFPQSAGRACWHLSYGLNRSADQALAAQIPGLALRWGGAERGGKRRPANFSSDTLAREGAKLKIETRGKRLGTTSWTPVSASNQDLIR